MTADDYFRASYRMTVTSGVDSLTVSKIGQIDGAELMMTVGILGEEWAAIRLRTQQHAEALHFMLGQLLGKGS